MDPIHPDATPLTIENDEQVGWQLINTEFEFQAIAQPSGGVSVYVRPHDTRKVDVTEYNSMADVKRQLDRLLQSSER